MYNNPLICRNEQVFLMLIAGIISSDQEAKEIDFIAKTLAVKDMVKRLVNQLN
jgi:hypothetical protein